MSRFLQKIGIGLAAASLVGASLASSVFAADLTISGNGEGSSNTIIDVSKCHSSVTQSNNTSVNTYASVSASTGGNNANSNTGGDVSITTGDATAGVSVSVDGGSNVATPPSCCECQSSPSVAITGNGEDSHNLVVTKQKSSTSVSQKNKTKVKTFASVKAKTGHNTSNGNTNGTTTVDTGDSTAGVVVSVTAPSNSTP